MTHHFTIPTVAPVAGTERSIAGHGGGAGGEAVDDPVAEPTLRAAAARGVERDQPVVAGGVHVLGTP